MTLFYLRLNIRSDSPSMRRVTNAVNTQPMCSASKSQLTNIVIVDCGVVSIISYQYQ